MEITYTSLGQRLFMDGNEILAYSITIPRILDMDGINSFYSDVANECEKYCTNKLFPYLCSERVAEKTRYTYKLKCQVTHCDGEFLSVVLHAFLRESGEKIDEHLFAHTWYVEDMTLVPPRSLCRKMLELKEFKKMKKDDFSGMYLRDGRLVNIRGKTD